MNPTKQPHFSEGIFWDVNPDTIDWEKHDVYVIERILNRGLWPDWLELFRYYGYERIKQKIINAPDLSDRTLNFCSVFFNIPKQNFKCYTRRQSGPVHWIY